MGYDDAINLATEKLSKLPPEEVCEACGAVYRDQDYHLQWFNKQYALSSVPIQKKILWLHYLTAAGSKEESGQLIAYREAAPALFYEKNFYKRAVKPLVNCFGKEPQKLIETGITLGGKQAALGDAGITIKVLPYCALSFIIWKGDDEFPPDGNILFDKSAITWFAPEDLAVIASTAVYDLISAGKESL